MFGPVTQPYYSVRDPLVEVEKGTRLMFAPQTDFSHTVFVDKLEREKGTDASWENDEEPPENVCFKEKHAHSPFPAPHHHCAV